LLIVDETIVDGEPLLQDFQSAIKKSTINNEFERVKRSETAAGRIFLTSSRQ
jgi:hypothetical protein